MLCTSDTDCGEGFTCEGGVCRAAEVVDGGDGGDFEGDGSPGPQPVIVVEPEELDFGFVALGSSSTLTLAISSAGTVDLTVFRVELDARALASGDFAVTDAPELPATLAPGSLAQVTVTYTPSDATPDDGALEISSDDPESALVRVVMLTEYKGNPEIAVDPASLDFGYIAVGGQSTQTVTVSNDGTGNAALEISEVGIDPAISVDFTATATAVLPAYLGPDDGSGGGDALAIDVTYAPQAPRINDQENLVIVSNDEDRTPLLVPLSARSLLPPDISLSDGVLDFGQVPVGASMDLTLTVFNLGDEDLQISDIRIPPPAGGASPFSFDPAAPWSVLGGASRDITVTYLAPGPEGQIDNGTLIIESNDPDTPSADVALMGENIRGNAPPTAIILADGNNVSRIDIMLGERVDLDGGTSSDLEGDPIVAYQWAIDSQPQTASCGTVPTSIVGADMAQATITPLEAGTFRVSLTITDDPDDGTPGNGKTSAPDQLDIVVHAAPQAGIVASVGSGAPTTVFIEVDLNDTVDFDGSSSSDCDGVVTEYLWELLSYPAGRGVAPTFLGGTTSDRTSMLFDFPGDYQVGLTVKDNDTPKNQSARLDFDVLVRGPQAFRVAINWIDDPATTIDDNEVDVDIHLVKPGAALDPLTGFPQTLDDLCYPAKTGVSINPGPGNPAPTTWGAYGSPIYQVDGYEDQTSGASPADELVFNDPGAGEYQVRVFFRCHSSGTASGDYYCCDDICPISLLCCDLDQPKSDRVANGTARIYVSDYFGVETEVAVESFYFGKEQGLTFQTLGTLTWPDGTFQ